MVAKFYRKGSSPEDKAFIGSISFKKVQDQSGLRYRKDEDLRGNVGKEHWINSMLEGKGSILNLHEREIEVPLRIVWVRQIVLSFRDEIGRLIKGCSGVLSVQEIAISDLSS